MAILNIKDAELCVSNRDYAETVAGDGKNKAVFNDLSTCVKPRELLIEHTGVVAATTSSKALTFTVEANGETYEKKIAGKTGGVEAGSIRIPLPVECGASVVVTGTLGGSAVAASGETWSASVVC